MKEVLNLDSVLHGMELWQASDYLRGLIAKHPDAILDYGDNEPNKIFAHNHLRVLVPED